MKKKFGEFVICINDPTAMLERIKGEWRKHPWASNGSACIAPVVYNKGEVLKPDPYLMPRPHYSYSQKPRALFEDEQEFRYVLTCTADPTRTLVDVLSLTLDDCNDICSLC